MRRKRRYKKARKGNRNSSFIIFVLSLLIFINISLLILNYFKGKSNTDSSKENFINKIVAFFNLKEKDNELISRKPNLDESVPSQNFEDEDEFIKHEDTIIIDKLEEYESLIIIKDSYGISSIANIPEPLNINKVKLDKEKPYILMYHTHSTESFLVSDPDLYYNSDTNKNVVSIGRTLATVLEANGHRVDHVETAHDVPSLTGSYSRSINTINKKKEENSNLKILLDIHRDGVEKDATYRDRFLEKARLDINGVSTASFSLVVGPSTPNYEKILSFAKYIKAVSDTLYPNLCTGIIIKPVGKFNLYTSDYSALIEVGSNLVSQEEANECAKLVGEILSLVIDSIVE